MIVHRKHHLSPFAKHKNHNHNLIKLKLNKERDQLIGNFVNPNTSYFMYNEIFRNISELLKEELKLNYQIYTSIKPRN